MVYEKKQKPDLTIYVNDIKSKFKFQDYNIVEKAFKDYFDQFQRVIKECFNSQVPNDIKDLYRDTDKVIKYFDNKFLIIKKQGTCMTDMNGFISVIGWLDINFENTTEYK